MTSAEADSNRPPRWLWPLLAIATALWYLPTAWYSFVNLDDPHFIQHNPVIQTLTAANLRAILTPGTIPDEVLYTPVTYLAMLAESLLFGTSAAVYHTANIVIHTLNVVLVGLLLWRWTGRWPMAAFGAAIFAFHPLQVEAVAWAMGQKDLLAVAFALLSLLAWERTRADSRRWPWLAAIVLGILAMLAKPSAIVLPAIWLLVAWWREGGCRRRDLWRALPLWLAASGIYLLNRDPGGAPGPGHVEGLLLAASVPRLVGEWLLRLLLVRPPEIYYLKTALLTPHPWTPLAWLLPLGGAIWLTQHAWRRHHRGLLTAILMTAIALFPAFATLFGARDFSLADRYSTFALFGVALALALLPPPSQPRRYLGFVGIVLVGITCAWLPLRAWHDSTRLWQYALRLQPEHHVAWYFLGDAWEQEGRLGQAMSAYALAIQTQPANHAAWNGLGNLYLQYGAAPFAERAYRQALGQFPGHPAYNLNLAIALGQQGEHADGLVYANRALAQRPAYPDALVTRGTLRYFLGDGAAASADFAAALAIAPGHPLASEWLDRISRELPPD